MRLAALVAAVVALGAFNSFRVSTDERRLGEVASAIAGRDVSVRCQGFFSELIDVAWRGGSVQFDASGEPADSAFLTRARCRALARLADGDEHTVAEAARGVETLAHEAYHLRGEVNEAVTQCYGLQTMKFAARKLGATPGEAVTLARYSWASYDDLPDEYRTSECRDGAALDLRPQTSEWP